MGLGWDSLKTFEYLEMNEHTAGVNCILKTITYPSQTTLHD